MIKEGVRREILAGSNLPENEQANLHLVVNNHLLIFNGRRKEAVQKGPAATRRNSRVAPGDGRGAGACGKYMGVFGTWQPPDIIQDNPVV
jgi:hypothetical protein